MRSATARIPFLLAAAVTITAGAACATDDGDGWRDAPVWSVSPEPTAVIGVADGDARYLFQRIAAARLLPDGRIVVADDGFKTIRVYSADGVFQREMGREGEGPGEFQWISGMVVAAPDTLIVYDGRAFRSTLLRADGALLETTGLLDEGTFHPELLLGRFTDGHLGVASISIGARDPARATPDLMRLGRTRDDGRIEVLATTTGMRRFDRQPMPFSPFLRAFVQQDSVYVTDGVRDITVLDAEGTHARTIETQLPVIAEADARAELAAVLDGREDLAWIGELSEVPVEDSIPRASLVLLDDAGRFWLQRYRPVLDSPWGEGPAFGEDGGGEWRVLDPVAGPLARLRLPDRFVPRDIRGQRILGVLRDDLDVERIAVYQVRTSAQGVP